MQVEGAKCPNHKEVLDDFSMGPSGLGQGRCPVSGVMFKVEVDPKTKKQDKFGNVTYEVIVTGED